ncbi:Cold shock protein of CSP family [hydrothermal vent metagenome]|uniref:Cold shock protein of CSP family n=1 Tax=hydrothermal vent metagenome TaxID=652676 RepID=A0A3B0ZGG8_9ZZZZ
MKAFLRFLSILVVSSLVAAAGAWATLYYLGFRLGELKALQALQWEPLIVIASIWFVTNLLMVYLLGRRVPANKDKVVSAILSEAAIASLHSESENKTKPVKSRSANSKPGKSKKEKSHTQANQQGESDQSGKLNGSAAAGAVQSRLSSKLKKNKQNKIAPEKVTTKSASQENAKQQKKSRSEKKAKPTPPVNGREESIGIVKWFNGQKGYGFIANDAGEEIFVHCRSIKLGSKRQLHTGQQVSFTLLREDKGLKAEDVVILE